MTGAGDVLYRLNGRDEIEFVNDAWGDFAAANGGVRLAAADVLGRPLWDFIADSTTRELYRSVLARIQGGRSVRFTFRCDSPACRRLLEMSVTSGPGGGGAEFRTRTLSEESRPRQPLLTSDALQSDELVRVCGWCKKVNVGGAWVEVEEAVSRLRLFERPLLPKVTHGICTDCLATVKRALTQAQRTA